MIFPPLPGFSRRCVVLCLAAALTPAAVRAEAPPYEVEEHKDIAYYTGDDAHAVKHKLDIYQPKGLKSFPVLFFVHGGAWTMGDKAGDFGMYKAIGRAYAKVGIGTVVTNYRLSPSVQHPEHIKDVARAFAWTHKNIAKYGGKTDQIFICGHSAGGHLVALLGTNEKYLKAEGLSTSNIRGVIPISGVYEIAGKFMPKVFGTDAEEIRNGTPIRQVREGLPPFCILFADSDFPGCGKTTSEAFCKALKGKKDAAQTVEIKDSNHVKIIMSASKPSDIVFKTIHEFITNHAK